MKRRTALKLSVLALAMTSVTSASAYESSKIVNRMKMKIKDSMNPTKGELKHTPEIRFGNTDKKGFVTVEVTIGQEGIIHPSSESHWIYKIDLYANGKKVSTVDLEPEISNGYLATKVKKDGLTELRAIAWCNLHGEWESTIKV